VGLSDWAHCGDLVSPDSVVVAVGRTDATWFILAVGPLRGSCRLPQPSFVSSAIGARGIEAANWAGVIIPERRVRPPPVVVLAPVADRSGRR
jgi:hypothetical protein